MTSSPSPVDAPDPRTGEFPIDPALTAAPAKGLGQLAVPCPRVLLAGILVARLILVALMLGRELGRADPAMGSIALVAAVAFVASAWLGWRLRRPNDIPGPSALLLQAAIDILVITSLISFTPAAATSVAALYVALVTAYALLLPVGRGLLAVGFAVSCYVWVSVHAAEPPDARFWTQICVIAFVGGLIAVLGNRLTDASRGQRALAAALFQARLEADEILGSIQSGVISVDGDGRLGYLNPRGRKVLERKLAHVI